MFNHVLYVYSFSYLVRIERKPKKGFYLYMSRPISDSKKLNILIKVIQFLNIDFRV